MTTKDKTSTRRRFLKVAAAGAAAPVAAPAIVSAQGPISMRWQSTWPSKDIFHEYALDYAKKVNDMTGGDLKIDVLPAGGGGGALRPRRARSRRGVGGRGGRWGARDLASAWTPTCCCPGTNTAAARNCSPSCMSRSAPMSFRSPTGRC